MVTTGGEDHDDGGVDLRLWGKSRGLGGDKRYPLACHLLDTGAMALYLWDHYVPAGVREFIAHGFGVTPDHAGRLVALWAALHDVGKLTPEFQCQAGGVPAGYPAARSRGTGHDVATHRWLQSRLPTLGYGDGGDGSPGFLVAQLLGGHHGTFHRGMPGTSRLPLRAFGFRDDEWERERSAVLAVAGEVLGSSAPPPAGSVQASVLACAVVVLADWLVSQEPFLVSRLGGLPSRGTADELRGHFAKSAAAAAGLAGDAGLSQMELRPGSFSSAFPSIEKPNALQRSLAGRLPGLVKGPGLLLVMAPPGVGKTETALYGAKVLGAATGRPGVYMALPTTATADQIYLRVLGYLRDQATAPASLMLLHGMAWLNTAYQPEHDAAQVLTDDPLAAADWLLGRWRGMCGAWAVGTIDQALMAVLKSRHNALRLFGLAGKTVIIDEVHACDPYMQGLLLTLLRWLGSFGTPVVLLSATLTSSAARELTGAYLEGSLGRAKARGLPALPEAGYPGWLYADGTSGKVTALPVALGGSMELRVEVREVVAAPGSSGGWQVADRGEALRAELGPLVEAGGCALVVCTTVNEAQDAFCQLRGWFAGLAAGGAETPELELLHARFPVWQRELITTRIMERFGKNRKGTRPRSAVLVATAIVEQSLDLDFDLVVSDLAPVALLLQRAGRCWRHEALGTIPRPPWAGGPRLAVLVPPGGPGAPPFGVWAAVYDASLLMNTRRLLAHRGVVSVPGDVQGLIDAVYEDENLVTGNVAKAAVLARAGDEAARRQLSRLVAIGSPDDVVSLCDLTADDVDPELLATRFDADSVRMLPVFADADGRYWLDRGRSAGVPAWVGRPVLDDCKVLVRHSVPVRGGPWLDRAAAAAALPGMWRRNVHLRDLVLLPFTPRPDGSYGPAVIGGREFELDPVLGMCVTRITKSSKS